MNYEFLSYHLLAIDDVHTLRQLALPLAVACNLAALQVVDAGNGHHVACHAVYPGCIVANSLYIVTGIVGQTHLGNQAIADMEQSVLACGQCLAVHVVGKEQVVVVAEPCRCVFKSVKVFCYSDIFLIPSSI